MNKSNFWSWPRFNDFSKRYSEARSLAMCKKIFVFCYNKHSFGCNMHHRFFKNKGLSIWPDQSDYRGYYFVLKSPVGSREAKENNVFMVVLFFEYTSPPKFVTWTYPLTSQIKTFNMGIASMVKKHILLNWIFTKKKESCFIRKHIDERIDKYNTVIDVNQIANQTIIF